MSLKVVALFEGQLVFTCEDTTEIFLSSMQAIAEKHITLFGCIPSILEVPRAWQLTGTFSAYMNGVGRQIDPYFDADSVCYVDGVVGRVGFLEVRIE